MLFHPNPYTVIRFEEGEYVNGVWQEGEASTFSIRASAQPADGQALESLPEARRNRGGYTVYTKAVLRSVEDTTNPDRIIIEGRQYEVVQSKRWNNGILTHTEAIVQQVTEPVEVPA